MSLNYRAIIDALLPKGVAWHPQIENKFNDFLNGFAESSQQVFDELKQLAFLRNPQLTSVDNLGDLEREYGLLINDEYTIQQRRDLLTGVMFAKPGSGSYTFLQDILNNAGFDVIVTPNNPAIDPLKIINAGFMWADFGTSRADYEEAVTAPENGTQLIVNTADDTLDNYKPIVQLGAAVHTRWNYYFFVGGVASGWPINPDIEYVSIPAAQRGSFVELILKYKPMHSWCVPVIQWTS